MYTGSELPPIFFNVTDIYTGSELPLTYISVIHPGLASIKMNIYKHFHKWLHIPTSETETEQEKQWSNANICLTVTETKKCFNKI